MPRSNWWRGGTKVDSFACEPLAGSGVHGPWTLTNNNHLVACFSWCASTERIKLQGSVNKSVRFTSTRRSHVISCVHLQPHWCPGAAMPMLGSLGQPAAPVRTPAARSVRKQAKVPATPTPCTQTTCASTTKTKTKLALLPSPQPVLRSFSVPLSIRTHLDTWGVKLRSKIELVRETWLGSMGVLGFRSHPASLVFRGSGVSTRVWRRISPARINLSAALRALYPWASSPVRWRNKSRGACSQFR